jgi:BirA family transcriptional regulator, biotin operon repressor / biotin---[acetyl-CoA-carboxylase] ligase
MMSVVKPILEVVSSTGSTNTDLLEREALPQEAVLRLAWQQTHGRGTRSKHWVSQPNDSLTFSLGWSRPLSSVSLHGWSLVVGAIVCKALSTIPDCVGLQLKWPNDLVFAKYASARSQLEAENDCYLSKVGGILVETRIQAQRIRIVTGIGLNLRAPAQSNQKAEADLAYPPGALCTAVTQWSRTKEGQLAVVQTLAEQLVGGFERFETQGLDVFMADLNHYDVLKNRAVQWTDWVTGQVQFGLCIGISRDGTLAVRRDDGQTVHLNSAGAQVRLILR